MGRRTLVTVRDLLTRGAVFRHGDEEVRGMRGLRWEMETCAAVLEAESEAENDPGERSRKAELGALIGAAAADFFEKPDNERGSVLSTARRHTKFLDYAQLRRSPTSRPPPAAFRSICACRQGAWEPATGGSASSSISRSKPWSARGPGRKSRCWQCSRSSTSSGTCSRSKRRRRWSPAWA